MRVWWRRKRPPTRSTTWRGDLAAALLEPTGVEVRNVTSLQLNMNQDGSTVLTLTIVPRTEHMALNAELVREAFAFHGVASTLLSESHEPLCPEDADAD